MNILYLYIWFYIEESVKPNLNTGSLVGNLLTQ